MSHYELPEYLQDEADREAEIHCRANRRTKLLASTTLTAIAAMLIFGIAACLEYFESASFPSVAAAPTAGRCPSRTVMPAYD